MVLREGAGGGKVLTEGLGRVMEDVEGLFGRHLPVKVGP